MCENVLILNKGIALLCKIECIENNGRFKISTRLDEWIRGCRGKLQLLTFGQKKRRRDLDIDSLLRVCYAKRIFDY